MTMQPTLNEAYSVPVHITHYTHGSTQSIWYTTEIVYYIVEHDMSDEEKEEIMKEQVKYTVGKTVKDLYRYKIEKDQIERVW